MEEKSTISKIGDVVFILIVLGFLCFGGTRYVLYEDTMRALKNGKVYDKEGNAYYCKMGEASKERLKLLSQAEKLKE